MSPISFVRFQNKNKPVKKKIITKIFTKYNAKRDRKYTYYRNMYNITLNTDTHIHTHKNIAYLLVKRNITNIT